MLRGRAEGLYGTCVWWGKGRWCMAQRLGTGLGLERGKKEETDERVLELARLAAIDSPLLGHSQPIHAVITQPSSEIRDPLALRLPIPSR